MIEHTKRLYEKYLTECSHAEMKDVMRYDGFCDSLNEMPAASGKNISLHISMK